MLTVPYLEVAEFKAFPTYLDLDTIRVGDPTAGDQDAELRNVLLRASQWVADVCEQPLHAHLHTESRQVTADRYGRIRFTPGHGPVRQVTALAYGYTPTAMTALADLTGVWIGGAADDAQNPVEVPLSGITGPWSGSLQFGGPVPGQPLHVTWTAACGYPNTTVATLTNAAATSLPLADVTGIQPGDVLRCNDPAAEEAVTVSGSWTPTTGPASIPLTTATTKTHAVGVNVSMLPHTAKTATVYYACALLLRPEVGAVEEAFSDAPTTPTTRTGANSGPGATAGSLITHARRSLRRYARTI